MNENAQGPPVDSADRASTPVEAIGDALEPADDSAEVDRQIDRAISELDRLRGR